MKTKWFSKFLTSLLAVTLIFGSVSLASAKGSNKGNSEQKGSSQGQKEDQSSDKQDDGQGQKEDQSSDKQVNNKDQKADKSTDKKINNKSNTKEQAAIQSKSGKTVEKRLNAVDSKINSITNSINTYFGVNADGTVDKELSKKVASKKYNSYKGKLKAEINKLRAMDKQLASYKKKQTANTADFTALLTKSKELQQLAADEIKRVKSLVEQASAPKTEDATPTEDTTTGDTTTVDPTDPTVPGDTTTPTAPVDPVHPTVPSL